MVHCISSKNGLTSLAKNQADQKIEIVNEIIMRAKEKVIWFYFSL
mgnify:CR=1 FL=1